MRFLIHQRLAEPTRTIAVISHELTHKPSSKKIDNWNMFEIGQYIFSPSIFNLVTDQDEMLDGNEKMEEILKAEPRAQYRERQRLPGARDKGKREK